MSKEDVAGCIFDKISQMSGEMSGEMSGAE